MKLNRRTPYVRALLFTVCCAPLTLSGCESFWKRPDSNDTSSITPINPPTLPGKAPAQRVSQFVFYSDAPFKTNTPLFHELTQLREQIYRELRLPPSNNVIQVYLFDTQDQYERFMRYRYPELPRRRAFFIAQPRSAGGSDELMVYTFIGDHFRLDLRHELTHAMLHSSIKDVPLWLDEGIAEYYELAPEKNGLNQQHLEAITKGNLTPDLATLEKLEKVEQMGKTQYQEAWAWVHWLMQSTPENRDVLLTYLRDLRSPNPPGKLLPRLNGSIPASESLKAHLTSLDGPAASLRPIVEPRENR